MSSLPSSSDFVEVVRKSRPRRPAGPDNRDAVEEVWCFDEDWDWSDDELMPVKKVQSVREGRKWGEQQRWYHLFVPGRSVIIGRCNGRIQEFTAPPLYLELRVHWLIAELD